MKLSLLLIVIVTMVLAMPAQAIENIILRESLGLSWSHELVQYPITAKQGECRVDAISLQGPAGEVPVQLSQVTCWPGTTWVQSARLHFFADLAPMATNTYTVRHRKARQATDLRVRKRDGLVDITTAGVGVRLLLGKKNFAPPMPATMVPGPLQAVQLPSGRWTGKGRFAVPFNVKSYESRIIAAGPLFAEVETKYLFDTGYWTFNTRVIQGCPMIVISEELDTGDSGQTWNNFDRYYLFTLNTGTFVPEQAFFSTLCTPNGSKGDQYCDLRKATGPWYQLDTYGYRLKYDEDRDDLYLPSWPSYSPRVSNHMRFVQPGKNAVGLATLNTADWRHPMSVRVGVTRNKELQFKLPLQLYRQDWSTDGFDSQSPNYTGKTLGVPEHTARRCYGIMLSPAEDEVQAQLQSLISMTTKLGCHPLDEIKDWILNWPDPLADAKWPEQSSPEGVKVLAMMRDYLTRMRTQGDYGNFSMGTYSAYRNRASQVRAVWPEWNGNTLVLSREDRAVLRRLCAYQAYMSATPGFFPWGVGSHLGNPNMQTMAKAAQAMVITLVPDHPLFRTWGDDCLSYSREYLQRFTRPGGAWFECPHYTLGATLGSLNVVEYCLGRKTDVGVLYEGPRIEEAFRFILDWLTPPDVRFTGHRVVVPFGNTSYQSMTPAMLESVIARFRETNITLAGQLQWGANQTVPANTRGNMVPEVVPELHSIRYPDYGVFFRHGFGTPNETYFALMAGDCVGHHEWDTDQMSYTLYAKGHPINLHFGNGYFPMFCRPWLRNRVSFDGRIEVSERYKSKVETAAFSPAADYVRASRDVDQLRALYNELPDLAKGSWTEQERKNWDYPNPIETIPLTTWYRQMLFLKDADPAGPNYFVLRDTFAGQPTRPTDLSLWFLATRMDREQNYFHFTGQCPVDMDVFVASPAKTEPKTGSYGHINQPYIRMVPSDPAYYPHGNEKDASKLPYGKLSEEQLLFRLHQPAGQGYCVVLYPRLKTNDPPATFTTLAQNAVKVQTPLSTDYVFIDSVPVQFVEGDLRFSGQAGAIRFYKTGEIVVINNEGKAGIAVAGKTITGTGPFSVTLRAGKPSETHTYAPDAAVQVQ